MPELQATDWKARLTEVAEADGEEWDRLTDAYDADWKAAHCQAFREEARARGWKEEHIESGWLDDLPEQALWAYERGADPAECARRDVPECEWEAANV